MTQTVNIRINSSDIGLVKPQRAMNFQQGEPDIGALRERPYVEPWRDRTERDYLARSHPGPSGVERAIADRLWEQVTGKAKPAAKVSPQFEAQWAHFLATRPQPSRRELDLDSKLFDQVASIGPASHQIGDSSHLPGKAGL